jgi:hypothetical protein
MANSIEIKIKQIGQFQNYYVDGILDLADDSVLNTVIQLVDVREPEKRATDFVQSFKLPATKRNNQAFQHIKLKGFQSYAYNPTQKLDCQIIVNGNQYFNGYMQVNEITQVDGHPTSYEVTVYAKLGAFFNDLADNTMRDLIDVSDFNHLSNIYTIAQSWGPIGTDPMLGAYKYPDLPPEPFKSIFFKPGIYYKGTVKPFSLGFGYVYPPIFVGQTDKALWSTQDFKPAFYIKTLFDRLLESQGVRYTSDFLNSEYFRRLIIPSQSEIEGNTGNAQLTETQIKNASVWAKYNPTGGVGINSNVGAPDGVGPFFPVVSVGTETGKNYGPYKLIFPNDTVAPGEDPGLQYNNSTGVLTIKKNGRYNLTVQVRTAIVMRLKYFGKSGSAGNLHVQGGKTIPVTLHIRNGAGDVVASNTDSFEFTDGGGNFEASTKPLACSLKNQVLSVGQTFYFTISFQTTGSNYKYKTYDTTVAFWYIANAGDYNGTIDLYIKGTEINGTNNPSEGSKFQLNLADTSVADGDMILMNDYLPNLKAIDFIKDLNKMYNLYWKWDPKGFFIIEPRDKFYTSQGKYVIKDWTYKVDNNEEQSIQPLYDLSTKVFSYSYDTDDTYENQDHESETKEVYGTKRVAVESDFVDGDNKTELSFAASPMIDFLGTGLIMPSFTDYKDDKRLYQKPGPRILFYGGFQKQYAWEMKNIKDKKIALTHFPYCGHLDSPTAPRWDLNWGISKKYYYGWSNLTQNTLFNQFWGDYIDEITDRSGHLLTINLILSELDMINLDIRDIIQIDQVHYRINKITHNPLNNKAEAELIKLKGIKATPAPIGLITGIAPNYIPDPADPGLVPTPKPPVPTPPKPNPWPKPVPPVPGGWPQPWPGPRPRPDVEWGTGTIWTPVDKPWVDGKNPWVEGTVWSWNTQDATGTTVTTTTSPKPTPWREGWNDALPVTIWNNTTTKDWVSNNNYSTMNSQKVTGVNNRVAASSAFVSIQGNNNTVAENAKNIQVVGNNNIIAPGVSNAMVVGDNQFVTKSNTTFLNGVEQPNRTPGARILKSPSNSAGHNARRLSGGANSTDANIVVNGGQDTNSKEITYIPFDPTIIQTPFGPKTA